MIIATTSLQAQAITASANPQEPSVSVPFIGCDSDGQTGPLEAPKGTSKVLPISSKAGRQLVYYETAQGLGVLGPRGWHCFGTYGSAGNQLFLSPEPIDTANWFSDKNHGFSGPAIQIAHGFGDTSGRFGVAQVIARVFPAYKHFVTAVIQENLEPATEFPFGRYPKDVLTYKNDRVVEYRTPAQTDGLGTRSYLQRNGDPIDGVAMLIGDTPDLLILAVRLPSKLSDLTPFIIHQVEQH
jgi:hypothetical protein